jgi:UDP-2,3-diacylglucosamine pyrophosphatase LpxH
VGPKLKFVLSDLHLGAGCAEKGGNCLEDFTNDKQFVDFVQQILQESEDDEREIELIINGDFFEFLQVPATDVYNPETVYPREAYLDSSEEASVKRLNIILEGHPDVFNALSDFMHISVPQRRITIIKGNHDVNLYWPRVKNRLREALGASGTRSSLLLFAEEFVSREKIYVAHGHQYTEKMNSLHDHLDPRLFRDPTKLYYPPGSHFVINFFNQVERERWFVDKVKPLTTLIWFALRWDFNFATTMLNSFIAHTPSLVLSDFAPDSGISLSPGGGLLRHLENDEERQQLAQQYADDPDFRMRFHRQILQYLEDAHIAHASDDIFEQTEIDSNPLVMGQAVQKQQQEALHRTAKEISKREGARVVLFGHTHQPSYEPLGETENAVINTGCWLGQRDLNNIPAETWEAIFQGNQSINTLPLNLPYARIDYDKNQHPQAQLLDFANKNHRFQAAEQEPPGFLTKLFSQIISFFRAS